MIMNMLTEKSMNNGVQKMYRFKNGYGASVIRHDYSYGSDKGLWEIAVIKFDGDDWDLIYNTPIMEDVLGHLNDEEVEETLLRIKNL